MLLTLLRVINCFNQNENKEPVDTRQYLYLIKTDKRILEIGKKYFIFRRVDINNASKRLNHSETKHV